MRQYTCNHCGRLCNFENVRPLKDDRFFSLMLEKKYQQCPGGGIAEWKKRKPLANKVISKPSSNKRSTVRKPQPKLAKRKLRAA
jgi:hypothetical protein